MTQQVPALYRNRRTVEQMSQASQVVDLQKDKR